MSPRSAVRRRNEGRVLAVKATHAVRLGRLHEAEAVARKALAAAPRNPEVLRVLADVALALRDLPTAGERLEQAIAHHPPPAPTAWHHALGEIRTLQGKLDQAIPAFQMALAQSPEAVETWRWLARVFRKVGHVTAATQAWRQVVALAPDDWLARNDLGTSLMEARDFEKAETAFQEALARATDDEPLILVNRARLRARTGRRAKAIVALQACLERHPNYAAGYPVLGSMLLDDQRFDEAIAAFRRGLAATPNDATVTCALGRALLESGAAAEALAIARACLTQHPGYSGALALETLAHLALGDATGAALLLDHERLVWARTLEVPEGFSDLPAFNRALAAHAEAHPTLLLAPPSHATSGGLHSGSLLVEPRGPVAPFEVALRGAVAAYSRRLAGLGGHPFAAHTPDSAFFDMWCVVLRRGGHQVPHIHAEAWLSGVYYPQVPPEVRDGTGTAGWLEFGDADRSYPRRMEPPVVRIRPEEGLLVLFPSYFYHRTLPFEGDGTRISVAFDLVPS